LSKMEKSTKIGIGIFLLIIVGFFILRGNSGTGEVVNSDNVREIVLDAKRFEFSQPMIEINQGEMVRINVNNIDGAHGINIPGFGVNGMDEVEFRANNIGEFPFNCATMCGPGHHNMGGKIIVK
jgi:cytochrome c oxidase subunit II